MAKNPAGRNFNVSVIGLSGSEKEKGQTGVGKSCFCNRFIHQVADKYHHEHISVLSQSDFGGRVINNDHFLYWGEVTKTDEGNNFTFHVIEQTEFIDDVSFTQFKTGRTDPYHKRCVQTKVSSAEKLMYICKDQLGIEDDNAFEHKLMPDGKMTIDGILCCFDVSVVPDRSLEKQVDYCCVLLTNAIKTRKPVVCVTTKNDVVEPEYVREIEKLLARREFRNSIPLVETSAHDNVNIETAFIMLAHMMDKSKKNMKVMQYSEASKARKEVQEVAKEAYKNLLRMKITDSRTGWAIARKKLEKESDYLHFVDLFGTDQAKTLVRVHTRQLREEMIKQKQVSFMKKLPGVLQHFLPDLETIGDRISWNSSQAKILRDSNFEDFFVTVHDDGYTWKMNVDFIDDNQEKRLPTDILITPEAEKCYQKHLNTLQEAHKKEEYKKELWSLLERDIDKPGGQLSDSSISTLFLGRECFNKLDEHDRQSVWDEYQRQLKNRLRIDFQELLWERHSVFRNLNSTQNLTEDDLNVIYNSLNDDQRFRKFHKLEDDRKVMLLNHVVFLEKPSVDRCFFHALVPGMPCTCAECQVSSLLQSEKHLSQHNSDRSHSITSMNSGGPIVQSLNLVLLGQDGLATELFKEIRTMCIDDEFKLDRHVYNMDYRPIEGDVMEEQNSFIAPNFTPEGCICVYNSQETLEYIRVSVLRTLEANLNNEDSKLLNNLPTVVMLAYEPYSPKELNTLRDQGKLLATSLRCEFIDIPSEDLAEKLKFYTEQIEQALYCIIHGSSKSINRIMEDTEPDLRILLCMMCHDPYPMGIPLQPFLNESSFVVTSDPELTSLPPEEDNVFMIDANLDYTQQKIEVTVTSYHGAHLQCQRGEIYHGYILVYCPKRKASLASLKAFAETVSPAYMLVVAVPEGGAGSYNMNDHSQGLKDGKEVAKSLQARFIQATSVFHHQTAMQVYEKFLREVWEHRDEVEDESVYDEQQSPPPAYDSHYQRPPQPLPNNHYQANKSTSSQSTEDSEYVEPLYDQPNILRQHNSDSERASSPSPPPLPSSSPPPPELYRNDMELVKPSMLKEKRDQFAGHCREQYRRSLPVMDSDTFKIRTHMSQSMTEHLDISATTSSSALTPLTRYQIKKSTSMKLAVRDEVEAWAINDHKRHPKSSTFPAFKTNTTPTGDDDTEWSSNAMYDRSSFPPAKPTTKTKPKSFADYALPRKSGSPRSSKKGHVQAPLALPEKIEISEVYGTVKDAVVSSHDSDYALVDDALPQGSKIHRIKSTSRKNEPGTDSEESEFSSLERDKNSNKSRDLYSKVNRKPTPHKKKHKQRNSKSEGPNITELTIESKHSSGDLHAEHRGCSNSPSEDSTGTGDELHTSVHRVKRRSVKKKIRSPDSTTNLSDSDVISSPYSQHEEETSSLLREDGTIPPGGSEDNDMDLNESGNWGTWLKKKAGRDPNRTIEKRTKDEERRKLRENEKKQKEQQKLQKKIKKKDIKTTGQSESGISLKDFSMSPNNPSVPHFIEKCIDFIEIEGLHAEGIYRIPGNKAQVDLLTSRYNEDTSVDISSLDIQVNAVATTLKGFFGDLTEPLVPVAMYDELINGSEIQDKSARNKCLRGVFLKINPLNYEVLKFLITHLHKVSINCDTNSMDSKNLSRCWWPTLIRMDFDTFEKMTKYSRIPEEILMTLIEDCSYFFHSGNEI